MKGASLEAQTKNCQTPLSWAAKNGNTEVAAFLVAQGANINHIDREGSYPLRSALMSGHVSVVFELMKSGNLDLKMKVLSACACHWLSPDVRCAGRYR